MNNNVTSAKVTGRLGSGGAPSSRLRPGMQLLSVAAGSGAMSFSAARLGANVTSAGISHVMAERIKARAR